MKTKDMLRTHPLRHPQAESLAPCVDSCFECAQACTNCADACLNEQEHLPHLVACIRRNLMCADICAATGTVLSRMPDADDQAAKALLQACLTACRACADECERHAPMLGHCRVCATACQDCATTCETMLGA
uniref:Four-helix bundle copper-binding protein n=1 Tax=Desulfovibrio sp. U5L TaxID=596152 RepID=I2PX65_9BACT